MVHTRIKVHKQRSTWYCPVCPMASLNGPCLDALYCTIVSHSHTLLHINAWLLSCRVLKPHWEQSGIKCLAQGPNDELRWSEILSLEPQSPFKVATERSQHQSKSVSGLKVSPSSWVVSLTSMLRCVTMKDVIQNVRTKSVYICICLNTSSQKDYSPLLPFYFIPAAFHQDNSLMLSS